MFSRTSYRSFSGSGVPTSPTSEDAPPPVDIVPAGRGQRNPTDVLCNRLHEIKRITKCLTVYFEGLVQAQNQHAATLAKLSGPDVIRTPLKESALFIPQSTTSTAVASGANADTPGAFGGGWADIIVELRDLNKGNVEQLYEFSKAIQKNVVAPLKKLRPEILAQIAAIQKDVTKPIEVIIKERETLQTSIKALSNALKLTQATKSLSSPIPGLHPHNDPFLLRAAVETQLASLTAKENELLSLVIDWEKKIEAFEKDAWSRIASCWHAWEEANSTLLLTNQQRSMMLAANVDALPPDSEWNYFVRQNHVVPYDTPMKDFAKLEYEGRNDPMTMIVKEGLLDRQKRVMKSWKSEFFVLSTTGHLHSYASSAAPQVAPTLTLALATCTLGPLAAPESLSRKTARGAEHAFFIEEANKTKHVLRGSSYEEAKGWWEVLRKYSHLEVGVLEGEEGAVLAEGDVAEEGTTEGAPEEAQGETDEAVSEAPLPALPPRAVPAIPTSLDLAENGEEADIAAATAGIGAVGLGGAALGAAAAHDADTTKELTAEAPEATSSAETAIHSAETHGDLGYAMAARTSSDHGTDNDNDVFEDAALSPSHLSASRPVLNDTPPDSPAVEDVANDWNAKQDAASEEATNDGSDEEGEGADVTEGADVAEGESAVVGKKGKKKRGKKGGKK